MRTVDIAAGAAPTDRARGNGNTGFQARGFSARPHPMKLYFQFALVLVGTLAAAALVTLGAPANAEVQMAVQAAPPEMVASLFAVQP
jgi:hypothetical protein